VCARWVWGWVFKRFIGSGGWSGERFLCWPILHICAMRACVREAVVEEVWARTRRVDNYVELRALVGRFMDLNPGVDPRVVDWDAYWDPTLEYSELLEVYERAYPGYRWREREESEEEWRDRIREIADDLAARLSLTELEELIGVLGEIVRELREEREAWFNDAERLMRLTRARECEKSPTSRHCIHEIGQALRACCYCGAAL
jgi:hypothetical protein